MTEQPKGVEDNHRRGPWSSREDDFLLQLIGHHGALNWVTIAAELGSRSAKQCRERFHQNLKPSLNHDPITPEEGHQIEFLVGKMGKRWAEIARNLNGRSDNAVKNWWNGSQNRRRRLDRRRAAPGPPLGGAYEPRAVPGQQPLERAYDPCAVPGQQPLQRAYDPCAVPERQPLERAHDRTRLSISTSHMHSSGSEHSQHSPRYTYPHRTAWGEIPLPSPCSSQSAGSDMGSNYAISPVQYNLPPPRPRVELPPLLSSGPFTHGQKPLPSINSVAPRQVISDSEAHCVGVSPQQRQLMTAPSSPVQLLQHQHDQYHNQYQLKYPQQHHQHPQHSQPQQNHYYYHHEHQRQAEEEQRRQSQYQSHRRMLSYQTLVKSDKAAKDDKDRRMNLASLLG